MHARLRSHALTILRRLEPRWARDLRAGAQTVRDHVDAGAIAHSIEDWHRDHQPARATTYTPRPGPADPEYICWPANQDAHAR
jgi:hypothetical protein